MSRKPSKSIQAVIITLVAGMIIPKIFDISGNALLDKFLWKGVLSASFSVATIIVGMLYAGKFITGKVAGGKSRISIFFILIAIFASAASAVCAFIREISPIIKIVLASVTILAITLLIAKLIGYCFKVKKDFKITQEKSVAKKESSASVLPVPALLCDRHVEPHELSQSGGLSRGLLGPRTPAPEEILLWTPVCDQGC